MDQKLEKRFRERAVALGNSGDPAALPELVDLTRVPVGQYPAAGGLGHRQIGRAG